MARRVKKSKFNLKIWLPIICVIVIIITFYMIYDIKKKVDKMENQNTINSEENIVRDEIEEENIMDNELENTDSAITNEPDDLQNTLSNTVENQTSNQSQAGVTDQKQKAIELVKKKWGEDNTVNYVFDYVNENGEYVIAVKDKASATVKYYFRVDLETEMVELD